MRPPEFTGGNALGAERSNREAEASMRPPEFTGGNWREKTHEVYGEGRLQ